jgi:hypothetical protein
VSGRYHNEQDQAKEEASRAYQGDPAMGSMIEDRVNTLTQTVGTASFLDNHVKELTAVLDHFNSSNRGLYNLLAKMRGHTPEEANVGCDAPMPDNLMQHLTGLEGQLATAAHLYDRQLDELASLI